MEFLDTLLGRPNTVRAQTSLFKHHILPLLSKEDAAQADKYTVYRLVQTWRDKKLAPGTIRCLLSLAKRYIEFNRGDISGLVDVRRMISRSSQARSLTDKALNYDEADKLLGYCSFMEEKLYPVVLIGLHTGMRRGEVFGLEREDVDLTNHQIKVNRSYNGPTKSGLGRVVPMTNSVHEYFMAHPIRSSGKVFPLFDPNPSLRIACRMTRIKEITFHGLRHTFCTLALESGMSPRVVADIVGHTSPTTTMSLYWGATADNVKLDFLP